MYRRCRIVIRRAAMFIPSLRAEAIIIRRMLFIQALRRFIRNRAFTRLPPRSTLVVAHLRHTSPGVEEGVGDVLPAAAVGMPMVEATEISITKQIS